MMNQEELTRSQHAIFSIALVIAIYAVVSFGGLALQQEGRLARYAIGLVSAHGLLVLGWYALLAWQARVALKKRWHIHRKIGRFSIFYVAALALVSGVMTWNFVAEFDRKGTGAGDGVILFQFIVYFGLAVTSAKRRCIDWHVRYLMATALVMLAPAHGLFVELIHLPRQSAILLIALTYLAVPLGFDFYTRGKIHRATVVLVGLLFLFFAVSIGLFVWLEGF